MKAAKIEVKIGSHATIVCVKDNKLTSENFVEKALIQCNVLKRDFNKNIYHLKTYALFERLNGIEVIIDSNECVYNLWSSKWKMNPDFQLIIKKHNISKNLLDIIKDNQAGKLFTKNKENCRLVNKFLISTENEIKMDQMIIRHKFLQMIDNQEFSLKTKTMNNEFCYFEKDSARVNEDEIVNNCFEEINLMLKTNYLKSVSK
jgi:hypothetical protein